MRVIATKVGFHGTLRQVDDEFDVADGSVASWFNPVEQPAADRPAARKKASTEAHRVEQPAADDAADLT